MNPLSHHLTQVSIEKLGTPWTWELPLEIIKEAALRYNAETEEWVKLKRKQMKPETESSFYSDKIDHSSLEENSHKFPEHEECVMCGSDRVTITDDKDICHECGFVYE